MADDDLPYQLVPQIEQLRRERENAVAYGMTDRVEAVDKQLRALGVAGGKRKAAAEESGDESEARRAQPQGRTARPGRQQTDQSSKETS